MEYGCHFYPLCDILKKDKNKSCLGDGAGRVNESGAGIDRAMGIETPFALPRQLMKTGQQYRGRIKSSEGLFVT